jgi:tRNA-uridine 2-sulfurtransferase
MSKPKVIVGLSGGVDSAVACKILIDQGFAVEAAFMKNWEEDDKNGQCNAEADLTDAQAVADLLKVKLHTVNFAHEYWERVFSNFLAEYQKGRTPNPDVLCNREIKFKEFLDFALGKGADLIATGHYAQAVENNGVYSLLRGTDSNKDQSYFLHLLNQYQLSKSMFPLGKLNKPEIRAIASENGFKNAQKKDSTGICFIGERNFRDFLKDYIPTQPGAIRTPEGQVIGEHIGLMYYTLGQRKGLHIGGHKDFPEAPWYVLAKDMETNELIVGQNPEHSLLASNYIEIENPHWVSAPPSLNQAYQAQCRYRQNATPCQVIEISDHKAVFKFEGTQYAATPGQSLVLYDNEQCLGGGVIARTKTV